jgi:hypothetical protein
MKHFSKYIFVGLLAFALPSHAKQTQNSEIWQCTDSSEKRYVSHENVKTDACIRIREFDQNTTSDVATTAVDAPSEPWGITAFCRAQKNQTCVVNRTGEQSGTLNGVPVVLYADSASVDAVVNRRSGSYDLNDAWDIGCRRDKMTLKKTCTVNRGALFIFIYQSGGVKVSIGDEHFPGSMTSIRIGQKRFDTSDRDGDFPQSAAILTAMKDGTAVVTRYMKWPYREWVDDEFTAYGAQAAVRVAQWLMKTGTAL